MPSVSDILGPPAGFPNCPRCPYVINGSVAMCVACASRTISPVPDLHCPICSQAIAPGESCRNALCRQQARHISRISAVSTFTGELATSVKRLKYEGAWGWARIFGRLVTGWLNANRSPSDIDLIVPNPTFADRNQPDRQLHQHTELVLRTAAAEDVHNVWPIQPELLTVAMALPKSATAAASDKQARAQMRYNALRVADTSQVWGRRVLVYDDVCTTGYQLDAVARYLRSYGAQSVEGLVLARAPWR